MPATQEQMDNLAAAIDLLADALHRIMKVQQLLNKFRNEVDPNDEFNSETYANIKTIFNPLYTTVRDNVETSWSTFKTAVTNDL